MEWINLLLTTATTHKAEKGVIAYVAMNNFILKQSRGGMGYAVSSN